jgi:A/G-specific adenine glycosylase
MLQQTTVATVTPRFAAWMRLFPTIANLAGASEQDILSAWEGLGYYSRARRLHAAAKEIMERHQGAIPSAQDKLLALPGIGSYTAAAIRAFAHNEPAVVLDTNIIRLLARWGNLTSPVDKASGKQALGELAAAFYPKTGCRTVASALMDLGAMICTAGKPACETCPLEKSCKAVQPERLPAKSTRKATTKITEHRAWWFREGKLYLEQSCGPRWTGLWILPDLGKERPSGRTIAELTYPITRYRVTMKVYPAKGTGCTGLRGFTSSELADLPIPTPHRKAIETAFHAVAKG